MRYLNFAFLPCALLLAGCLASPEQKVLNEQAEKKLIERVEAIPDLHARLARVTDRILMLSRFHPPSAFLPDGRATLSGPTTSTWLGKSVVQYCASVYRVPKVTAFMAPLFTEMYARIEVSEDTPGNFTFKATARAYRGPICEHQNPRHFPELAKLAY